MTDTSVKKRKRSGARSLIFRIIIIVIAGLTVGLSVFSWNAQRLVGNQLPMPFGFGASVVLSPSMEPALHTDDLVFVTEQDAYDVDDIVVYQDGTMLVIHRVISIDGDTVITQGDANNVPDSPITLSQIKGKMIFHIPYIGIVVKFIKTVPGTLLILALAIFLMYRSRRKEKDKDNAELDKIVAEIRALQEQQAVAAPSASAPIEAAPPVAEDPQPEAQPVAEPVAVDTVDTPEPDTADAPQVEASSSEETSSVAAEAAEPADQPASGEEDLGDVHAMLDDLID